MPNFDSTKTSLKNVLDQIVDGRMRLPDFQRGWVWDDEHIRSLLVSIARGFPIGVIMLLENGGEARFQVRLVEGVEPAMANGKVEQLILDGQQRLTSLTQVLRLSRAVKTKDAQKREVERYYYIDVEKALQGNGSIEDAIIGVDSSKTLKSDFGRKIDLDLSTQEKEFGAFYFPCNQILNSDRWEEGLMAFDVSRFPRYMKFRSEVLSRFRDYEIPIISLSKENSKEAVCIVFEKVNTGGVSLSVFELVTATYAADGVNLREEWFGSTERKLPGRKKELAEKPLLREITPTDFLQGISLLYTYDRHQQDLQVGRTAKEVTAVSARREQVLALPLNAYLKWNEMLTKGFLAAAHFLEREGFQDIDYLPYRTQLVPLAAVMVHLQDRWLEPVIYDKLARWFWCGVFGELYGGAVETRVALDVQDLLSWINEPAAGEPATVVAAGFQPSRLDTLRTRTSAAYRGLYVLLQRDGSKDFFWKTEIVDLDPAGYAIDIHHIFPRKWCVDRNVPERVFNSIVNKTPISYKANRKIGGAAPSYYLEQLRTDPQVQMTVAEQDAILKSHLIQPDLLRSNDFNAFYEHRKRELIKAIERAMGKPILAGTPESPAEDVVDDEVPD